MRPVPDEPWINRGAMLFLARTIKPDWKVLEFGSGGSTVWYAKRAAHVTSFEGGYPESEKWFQAVRRKLALQKLNTKVTIQHLDYTGHEFDFEPESFDLVVIDGKDRHRLFLLGMSWTKKGGYMLLDDAQRPPNIKTAKYAKEAGWTLNTFGQAGIARITDIWRKP